MTPDPIRAALERLVKAAECVEQTDPIGAWWWLDAPIAAARAALDAAPPDGPATPPTPAAREVVEALAARPLLEQVAAIGDCISEQTVGRVRVLANQASAWLAENPPGQPVAIEPRGCPMPGACSCVELPTPTAGEVVELVEELHQLAESLDEDGFFHSCDQLRRAAALLEQLSAAQAPQPVAVSERLPGPEDCDAVGRCWFFDPCDHGWWWLRSALFIDGDPDPLTHWLPAHALPLPTTPPAGQEGADG